MYERTHLRSGCVLKKKFWYQSQTVLINVFQQNLSQTSWKWPISYQSWKRSIANYRPISLLPIISKTYERVLFEQIEKFSEKISPKLCGFRKGHSTQHALLNLLKNWQKTLDKSGVIGTVLMDLSKAYDCLPHDLLIAKLAAYGFEDSAISLISITFLKDING